MFLLNVLIVSFIVGGKYSLNTVNNLLTINNSQSNSLGCNKSVHTRDIALNLISALFNFTAFCYILFGNDKFSEFFFLRMYCRIKTWSTSYKNFSLYSRKLDYVAEEAIGLTQKKLKPLVEKRICKKMIWKKSDVGVSRSIQFRTFNLIEFNSK